MFPDYKGIKLEIKNKCLWRISKYLKNYTVLNKPWVNKDIIKYFDVNENENTTSIFVGHRLQS